MRIRAFLAEWGASLFAFVPVIFSIDELGIDGNLSFLIDTGASSTCIGSIDAKRNRITYEDFNLTSEATGVGKGRIYDVPHRIKLTFETCARGKWEPSMRDFKVLENPSGSPVPSLLGNDFLDSMGFRLVYDRPISAAYLEV